MSLPYFPMYPSDFEAKTSHLTLAEDGAYNRLLRICWMTPGCTIPSDEAWIMRRVRAHTDADKDAVRNILEEYFTLKDGRYSNARLVKVWLEANEAHEKRKNAGSKGGKAKALKTNNSASSNAVAKPKQPEPEPEPDRVDKSTHTVSRPKPQRFQEFWDQYPHRGGAKKGRGECEEKYARAVAAGVPEQILVSAAIRYRSDAQVLRGFGRTPVVWLNKKGWEDDIEPTGPNTPTRNSGPSTGHDSLMAGFAQSAHPEPGAGGSDFDGGETAFGPHDAAMGGGQDCYPSQPLLRVIGSE